MIPLSGSPAGQLALAFAAGAISVLAFAPFALAPLAVLGLALLFYLWRNPPRSGFNLWTGISFGLGLMGFGVFWLRISIAQFGGVNLPLAITATLLLVAFMALYYGLVGRLGERLVRRADALSLVLLLPALWVLGEWLRGWLFTGFPWLALGYSQIDTPLAGLAPVGGVYLVSFAVALSAVLINLSPRLWPMLALLVLWTAAYALQGHGWVAPAGESFQASLLQGNIPQAQKWQASMRRPTIDLYLDMTAASDSRLVIWPETAVPAFVSEVEDSLLRPLDRSLSEQGRDLLLGIVDGRRDGDYFNAMLSLGAGGRVHYHKRHLVPFGEYLPLDSITRPLLDWLHIPMSDFAVGAEQQPLPTLAGYPAGVDICYEDAYASEILRALPQAAFLVNASNDAWFGDSLAPHQHLEIARMRALESGRYLLRATNTGISAVIDQHGALRGVAPQFRRAVLTEQVLPLRGATPFVRWGNAGVVTLAVLLLLIGVLRQRAAG